MLASVVGILGRYRAVSLLFLHPFSMNSGVWGMGFSVPRYCSIGLLE